MRLSNILASLVFASCVTSLWAGSIRQGTQPPLKVTSIEVAPIPASLTVGDNRQLTVTAGFEDGSFDDVTASEITFYTLQPEGVVQVDSAGLLTAVAPGEVQVIITHTAGWESAGASTSIYLAVRQEGDADGDGMGDDYETANGLNPNLADAHLDPDGDGLKNIEERDLGTLPLRPDTDGDGVWDWVELQEGTDPTIPDQISGQSRELDESCWVSALNRTTQADEDGIWVLPNVPANIGRVRIRATCLRDGVTRSGQSDFVAVPADGIIQVPEIRFDEPAPIPASLRLTSPIQVLDEVGQTLQLSTIADLPDGGEIDVTSGATDTTYATSNDSVATISENGLVTAQGSGTALISAIHDGTLALLSLQVVTQGDADMDGIADDWELDNGLDPQDSDDALSDRDLDGLTALQEFQLGLDPNDRDSDDDRLDDGDEVNVHGTDPLRFDTDGDLISDGLEVQSGSNPLDATSASLTGLVTELSVDPTSMELTFNTIIGEVSRPVVVTAVLIDGTVLNATGGPYSTVYSSTDLSVAGFGSEPGRIFGGQNGIATVTATVDGFSAEVVVEVDSFAPQALSSLRLPGYLNALDLQGDLAYIAAGGAGLHIVDVQNPAAPVLVSSLRLGGLNTNANGIDVEGSYSYIAAGETLRVVDIIDPQQPVEVVARSVTKATAVLVEGGLAYVGGSFGVTIFDLTDPTSPSRVGSVATADFVRGLDLVGSTLYAADTEGGLRVIDVSDPSAPAELGWAPTRFAGTSRAADVAVRGSYAYVADGADGSLGGLRTLNVEIPTAPFLVSSSSDAFGLTALALDGPFALAADIFFVNSVPIFQIEDQPAVFQASLPFDGSPSFRDDNGQDLVVRNDLVFMVGNRGVFTDNRSWGNGALHIGRYVELQDLDGVAPEVSITSPADGDDFLERRSVTVEVAASDDVRVALVELWLDGAKIAEDRWSPYSFEIQLPSQGPDAQLVARAVDLAGAQTDSVPVNLDLLPDTVPTVRLLAPGQASELYEGSEVSILADAGDDIGVDSVEILVNGNPLATLSSAPYLAQLTVPAGPSVEISATATDGVAQTAQVTETFSVLADPPPTIRILEPTGDSPLTGGSLLTFQVAAADNFPPAQVELEVDGATLSPLDEEPYQWATTIPVSGDFLITATVEDTLGQRVSESLTLQTQPDPLTSVAGTVEDLAGNGIVAMVECGGVTGSSLADGTFLIANVPTLASVVSCSAEALGATALSALVPPEPAGVTQVGPIRLGGRIQWIVGGTNRAVVEDGLYALDSGNNRLVGWSQGFLPNLRGLAFDDTGRLWATDFQAAYFGQPARSELMELNPNTGEALATVGLVREQVSNDLVGISDLVWDAANGRILALETDGLAGGTRIFVIDRATAQAQVLASTTQFFDGGLTIAPDGKLYTVLRRSSLALEIRSADSGALLETSSLGSASGGVTSLDLDGEGNLLMLYRSRLYSISEDPWQITLLPTPDPLGGEGSFSALLGWVPDFAPVTATVTGLVVDSFGSPVAGADALYFGSTATTGVDGRFTLPNLLLVTEEFRIFATSFGNIGISAPAMTGSGTIDVGTIQLSSGGGGGG